MGHAKVDQARLLAAGDHLDRRAENGFGGRQEGLRIAQLAHGVGRQRAHVQARHALRRVVFDTGRVASLVEEAPAAYRDISEVLEDEEELVTPLLRLTPIAVLKG